MKKIPCGNSNCSHRRTHWSTPDIMREHKEIEVPDDFVGKTFCSITCACLAGYYDVKSGWVKDPQKE